MCRLEWGWLKYISHRTVSPLYGIFSVAGLSPHGVRWSTIAGRASAKASAKISRKEPRDLSKASVKASVKALANM